MAWHLWSAEPLLDLNCDLYCQFATRKQDYREIFIKIFEDIVCNMCAILFKPQCVNINIHDIVPLDSESTVFFSLSHFITLSNLCQVSNFPQACHTLQGLHAELLYLQYHSIGDSMILHWVFVVKPELCSVLKFLRRFLKLSQTNLDFLALLGSDNPYLAGFELFQVNYVKIIAANFP